MKTYIHYVVQRKGKPLLWKTSRVTILGITGPKVKDGMIRLGEDDYPVVPEYAQRRIKRTLFGYREDRYFNYTEELKFCMPPYRAIADIHKIEQAQLASHRIVQDWHESKLYSEAFKGAMNLAMLLLAGAGGFGIGAIIGMIAGRR